MKLPKSTFELLSFIAVLVGFFFMGASFLDNNTFVTTRNATLAVGWFLVALWCQREAK
jgi:hypothetical protein